MNRDAKWCFAVAASASAGFGHMRRCLAVAAAMPVAPDFWLDVPDRWASVLDAAGFRWRVDDSRGDPTVFATAVAEAGCRGALLDDYRFNDAHARALASRVFCVRFDDFGTARCGDVVVAPALAAVPDAYPPGLRALCGARFAPVDPQIAGARAAFSRRPVPDRARQVLVAFGSRDGRNLTESALDALLRLKEPNEVTVVLGPDAPFLGALRTRFAGPACRFVVEPLPQAMFDLLAEHDLAIGSAGVSFVERLCVGLPSIVVDAIDNQRGNIRAARELGLATVVADADARRPDGFARVIDAVARDPALRSRYRAAGTALVDAEGAARIARILSAEAIAA
jgi:spore coat polysaccharide biosynthesis predicted glycosyltransferase SpsG